VESRVSNDIAGFVYGNVWSDTKELVLETDGRTQILWCGNQMWMSVSDRGANINRGVCSQHFPRIVNPVTGQEIPP
jgi:hypothetical protein